jgi:AGCS family alanine or glycine:cation symporter
MGRKRLARLFALFTLIACFGIGNMAQSNSIAAALHSVVNLSPWISAALIGALMSIVLIGGIKRIGAVNERLVPVMASFYIVCALSALILNFKKIPEAFSLIFREAFNFRALGGAGIFTAMRYGFSRGIFSNEAGLGSAPIAHASSDNEQEVEQGFWGMFEVFFTTIVICTLTALVIIIAGIWEEGTHCGTALSIASFDKLLWGSGSLVVTTSSVLFAISSVLGWAYYGEVAANYIFGKNKKITEAYRVLYIAVAFMGAVGSMGIIWQISETMNALMALPNLIALFALGGTVGKMTKEYFLKKEERYVHTKTGR